MRNDSRVEPTATGAPPRDAGAALRPGDRVRMAQGFLLLAIGLALFFLLAVGGLRIPALDLRLLPAYAPALAIVVVGLRQVRLGSFADPRSPATWRSVAPVGALVYLAPFYGWWSRIPHHAYYLAHLAALVLAGAWLLYETTRVCARAADRMGARTAAVEARLCGLVTVAAAVPVPVLMAAAAVIARRNETSLYAEVFRMIYHLPRGWIAAAILPVSLAIASCWRLRNVALSGPGLAPDNVAG